MKKILYFPYLALVLVACGGDNGDNSVVAPEKRSEVSSVYELGACNMQNASEFIWVKNENATYFCDGIQWQSDATISYSSTSIVEIPYSSSVLELPVENNILSSSAQLGIVSSSSSFLPSKEQDSIVKTEYSSSLQSLLKSSSSVAKSSSSRTLSSSSRTSNSSSAQVFSNTFKDSRDGQTYKTVTIGSQTWMAENLKYKTKNSSCYDNDESNCLKYGRLYPWADAMDSMGSFSTNGKGCGIGINCIPQYPVIGVCPSGWYLPSKDEWSTLFANVGGQSTAGYMLKAKSGWQDNGNGVDRFAFSAYPAGSKSWNGNYASTDKTLFLSMNESTTYWSSTLYEDGNYSAYRVVLKYDYDEAFLDISGRPVSYSVRCLKGASTYKPSSSSSKKIQSSSSQPNSSSSTKNSYNVGEIIYQSDTIWAKIDTIIDSRDGNVYRIFDFGDFKWMSDELRYETKSSLCFSCGKKAYSSGYLLDSYIYGRAYHWADAMNLDSTYLIYSTSNKYVRRQGICPSGWHIPDSTEAKDFSYRCKSAIYKYKGITYSSPNPCYSFYRGKAFDGVYGYKNTTSIESDYWVSNDSLSANVKQIYNLLYAGKGTFPRDCVNKDINSVTDSLNAHCNARNLDRLCQYKIDFTDGGNAVECKVTYNMNRGFAYGASANAIILNDKSSFIGVRCVKN